MRWVRIAIGLAVLAFVIWFGSHLRFTETKIPIPLKGEAITNPFYAAIRFSEQLGADAAWERVLTLPPSNSVILLADWNWSMSSPRRARIEQWVRDGGRLVVDDSLIGGAEEFEKWAGISRYETTEEESKSDEPEEDSAEQKQKRRVVSPRTRELLDRFIRDDCTPLTEDGTRRTLRLCNLDTSRSLTSSRPLLWALRDDKRLQALRVAVGRGSVTVLNASPFRHRDFFEGDHPTLFVTATQLHRADHVFFFTEEDHASLLTLVWRFAAPVVLLLAALVFMALWRNTTRFGPLSLPPEKARRSLSEQIRGTGLFTLRFGGGRALHEAMVRALREAAVKRLPWYDRLSSEERVEAISKATGVLVGDLGPAMNYQGARTAHELRNTIAVLETARRRLATAKKTPR